MAILDVLTLNEAKASLNVTGTTQYDTELPGYITAVSQRLDTLCGPVVRRTVTGEQLDGGFESIFVEFFPVTSFTSIIEYDGVIATVLTSETNFVQPDNAYRSYSYQPDPTLYGNRLVRRSAGFRKKFTFGIGNVVVTYVPGRFADTVSVGEKYKKAAGLILQNLWRSQQDSTGRMDEFDVPMQMFPKFAVPNAALQLLCNEVHEEQVLLA